MPIYNDNAINLNNCYIIVQSLKDKNNNHQCKNKKKTGNFCQLHINMYAKKNIDLTDNNCIPNNVNMIRFNKIKYKTQINTHIQSQTLQQIKDKIDKNNIPWYM